MSVAYSPTADPRVRIARHLAHKWRTEVEAQPGQWRETGPEYMTRADALTGVESAVLLFFGTPEWSVVHRLRAQVEQLSAEKADLAERLRREKDHVAALMVDGDRKLQRALALLPDCEVHRTELQYLRHCVSWYWHAMNDSDEARHAIVGALGNTVLAIQRGAGPTVQTSDLLPWLEQAIDKQERPLNRHSFPTLADCLRSAHGDCDHDGVCGDVIAEVAEAFGLTLADQPAKCKPVKARR